MMFFEIFTFLLTFISEKIARATPIKVTKATEHHTKVRTATFPIYIPRMKLIVYFIKKYTRIHCVDVWKSKFQAKSVSVWEIQLTGFCH